MTDRSALRRRATLTTAGTLKPATARRIRASLKSRYPGAFVDLYDAPAHTPGYVRMTATVDLQPIAATLETALPQDLAAALAFADYGDTNGVWRAAGRADLVRAYVESVGVGRVAARAYVIALPFIDARPRAVYIVPELDLAAIAPDVKSAIAAVDRLFGKPQPLEADTPAVRARRAGHVCSKP